MASTGNVFPTVGANVDRAGNAAWTNPGNVVSDNATDTTGVVPTDYLVTSGYDFSIPSDAIIHGVTVRVEASETGTGSSNYIPQLHSATTPTLIGSAKSAVTVSGTTKVVSTTGGVTDLWGATLTPAIVNDAGFGVSIWSTDTVNTLAIDFVTIAIEYSLPPYPKTKISVPQDADSIREFSGYAVVLAACAALFGSAGVDTVGAAEYTVGTHQAAIAQDNNRSWIKGTPPQLIPVAVVESVPKPFYSAPEQIDSSSAVLFSPPVSYLANVSKTASTQIAAPEQITSGSTQFSRVPQTIQAVVARYPRTVIAAPEQVDSSYSQLSRYSYQFQASVDTPLFRTLFVAPEQVESGSAVIYRYPPILTTVGDIATAKTFIAAPEQIDSSRATVWGTPAEGVTGADAIGSANYTVGTHQYDIGAFVRTGQFVTPEILGTDVAISRTATAAPEQVNSGSAWITGQQPVSVVAQSLVGRPKIVSQEFADSGFTLTVGIGLSVDRPNSRTITTAPQTYDQVSAKVSGKSLFLNVPVSSTLIAAPEQIDSAAAKIYGTDVAAVVTLDAPPPKTIFAAPQQTDVAYSKITGKPQFLDVGVAKTLIAAPEQTDIAAAQVFGTDVAVPPGTDTPVGHFAAYFESFYEPVQYGLSIHPNSDLIPPAVIAPDQLVRRGGGKPRHRKASYEERLPSQYKRLEEMVDDVSAELAFKNIQVSAPPAVKQQAVLAIAQHAQSETAITAVSVDWDAVEEDVVAVRKILSLWMAEKRRQKRIRDDEEWFMLGD